MNTQVAVVSSAAPRPPAPTQTRSTSRPYIQLSVKLYSHQAQQVFRRVFNPLAHGLYQMSVVLGIIADDKGAEQVEGVVIKEFEAVEKEIRDEMARLTLLIEKYGVTNTAEFTNALEAKAEVSSPLASRFLGVITQIDELVKLIGAVWLTGGFTNNQYRQGAYKWQRVAIKFAGRVRMYCLRAVAAARKAQQAEDVVSSGKARVETDSSNAGANGKGNGTGEGGETEGFEADEGDAVHQGNVDALLERVTQQRAAQEPAPAPEQVATVAPTAAPTTAKTADDKSGSKVKAARKRA